MRRSILPERGTVAYRCDKGTLKSEGFEFVFKRALAREATMLTIRGLIQGTCVLAVAIVCTAVSAVAETPAQKAPATFQEAHALYSRHADALTRVQQAGKCDEKAIAAISEAEGATVLLRQWIGAVIVRDMSAAVVPVGPGPEPVVSADDLKGRITWARFMIGRLTHLIRFARSLEACAKVVLPQPVRADRKAFAESVKPACANEPKKLSKEAVKKIREEAQKVRADLAERLGKISDLNNELNGIESLLAAAERTLKEVAYYRKNPAEKPEDFDLATEEADALAERRRRQVDKERIVKQIDALGPEAERLVERNRELDNKCQELADIDPCLVGTWTSEPLISIGEKLAGGDGIVLTIKEDGTATVNYDKMKQIPGGAGGSALWRGSATGRLESKSGKLTVTGTEGKSSITATVTDPKGQPTKNPLSGFGPLLPARLSVDYSCEQSTLATKGFGYEFTFRRAQ